MRLPRPALLLKLGMVTGMLLGLIACETIGYYEQAARGQLEILLHRQPISEVIDRAELPPPVLDKLAGFLEARDFAVRELQLAAGDSYLSYVDLDRDHVVWNVFAAPEFSTEPVTWCYPIAGCVSYRGYFSAERAGRFAQDLQQRGLDVYTGGVDAYSTLGWFDDPLLSTVIDRSQFQLAALLFHELAHLMAYVPGDTTFNESFATAVEREGLRRWLRRQEDEAMLARAEAERVRREEFVALVLDYRERLDAVYREELPPPAKRERKRQLQAAMRDAYGTLRREWGDTPAYDTWFAGPLNNAQLATVSSYNDLVPAFEALLESVHGDLGAFYAQVREIADLDEQARAARLSPE